MAKSTVHVVAGIIYKENKILLCRRKEGKSQAGFWEFPGGKVEKNESNQKALYREIKEELGIEIKVKDFYVQTAYSYPTFNIVLWVYTCEYESGEIKPTDHDKFEWVVPPKLPDYPLSPADIEVAEKLAKA